MARLSKKEKSKRQKNKNGSLEKKKSSYQEIEFVPSNTNLRNVCERLRASDGALTKEDIIKVSNRTFFQSLKYYGFIEEKTKGIYTYTKPLEKKYNNEITKLLEKDYNNKKGNYSFGGSNSGDEHKKTLSNIISCIPDSVFLKGNYKNGCLMTSEQKVEKHKDYYKESIEKLKESNAEKIKVIESNYQAAMRDLSLSEYEKSRIQSNYQKEMNYLKTREKTLNDNKRGVSPVDAQVKMDKSEFYEFYSNIKNYIETIEDRSIREQLTETFLREERYVQTTSSEEIVTINLEVTTGSYKLYELIAKQNSVEIRNERLTDVRAS